MKYNLRFNSFDYMDGDEYDLDCITEIFVNEKEILAYSDIECQEQLKQVINYINSTNKDEYTLKSVPKQISNNNYEFNLFIDDFEIGNLENETITIIKVLHNIGVKFTYYAYDFDWGKWFDNGKFEIENDVEIYKYNY